jgi:L-galactose dehydrogenase
VITAKLQRKAQAGARRLRAWSDEWTYQRLRQQTLPVPMEYTTLGRTNLRVSVMGLGSGGASQLGLKRGHGERHAIRLIQRALDHGINLLDTAYAYGNEAVIGKAIQGRDRDRIVISTKRLTTFGGEFIAPDKLSRVIDKSLERLGTDYVDIFHMHGVELDQYDYTLHTLVPVLQAAKQAGKIRCIGITETFSKDIGHAALQRALQDDVWDVMMVGFNLLNQTARTRVIEPAQAKNIGILNMFAVRRALTDVRSLTPILDALMEAQKLSRADFKDGKVLAEWLSQVSGSQALTETAYRYCRHEPGIDTVLFGTSSLQHLDQNIESLLKPALDNATWAKINSLFEQIHGISGD